MSELNLQTIIPASPISKVNGYVAIPVFNYDGIIWTGGSSVIFQYNYSADKNFVLKSPVIKPIYPPATFCPVIRYRIREKSFRYKLWWDVGEKINEEIYNGQLIKKNF